MSGAGQPYRFSGERRPLYPHSAQGDTGGRLADCVHRAGNAVFQGRELSLEPRGSVFLLGGSGVFRVYEVG